MAGRSINRRSTICEVFQIRRADGIQDPYDAETILAAKEEVVKANGFSDAYLRPVARRGSEMMAVSAQHSTIHVAVAAWLWPSMFDPA